MRQIWLVLFVSFLTLLPSSSLLASDGATLRRYVPFARNRQELSEADKRGFQELRSSFQQEQRSDDRQRSQLVLSEHMRYDQFSCKEDQVYLVDKKTGNKFCLMKIESDDQVQNEQEETHTRQSQNDSSFELDLLGVVREQSRQSEDNGGQEDHTVARSERIDLRYSQSPVRHQGQRNTCTIFASIAAMECQLGGNHDISEQDAYWLVCRDLNRPFLQDSGVWPVEAARTLTNQRVCSESAWPYENVLATAQRPANATKRASYCFSSTSSFMGNSDKGRNQVRAMLANGRPVVACFYVAWDNQIATNSGTIDVVTNPQTGQPVTSQAGHSMLIVGYDDHKQRYIVKNSWGTTWGDRGYCYMSYAYYNQYAYSTWYAPASSRNSSTQEKTAGGFTE